MKRHFHCSQSSRAAPQAKSGKADPSTQPEAPAIRVQSVDQTTVEYSIGQETFSRAKSGGGHT